MVGGLLLRGMPGSVVAAVVAFGFAKIFGESKVDQELSYEEGGKNAGNEADAHLRSGLSGPLAADRTGDSRRPSGGDARQGASGLR
jgi:hypothetical protein